MKNLVKLRIDFKGNRSNTADLCNKNKGTTIRGIGHLALVVVILCISVVSPSWSQNVVNRNGNSNSVEAEDDHGYLWERDAPSQQYGAVQTGLTTIVSTGGQGQGYGQVQAYGQGQGQGYGQGQGGMQAVAAMQSPYVVPPPPPAAPAVQPIMASYGHGPQTQGQPMTYYYQNMPSNNPPIMMAAAPASSGWGMMAMSSPTKEQSLGQIFMGLLGLFSSALNSLSSMAGLIGLSGLAGLSGMKGLVGLKAAKALLALPLLPFSLVLLLPILLPLTLIAAAPLLLLLLIPVPVLTPGRRSARDFGLDSTAVERIVLDAFSGSGLDEYLFSSGSGSGNGTENKFIDTGSNSTNGSNSLGILSQQRAFGSNHSEFEAQNSLTAIVAKEYARLFKSVLKSSDCVERFSCELSRVARDYKIFDPFSKMITYKLSFVSSNLVEKIGAATKSGVKCKKFKCMGWLF